MYSGGPPKKPTREEKKINKLILKIRKLELELAELRLKNGKKHYMPKPIDNTNPKVQKEFSLSNDKPKENAQTMEDISRYRTVINICNSEAKTELAKERVKPAPLRSEPYEGKPYYLEKISGLNYYNQAISEIKFEYTRSSSESGGWDFKCTSPKNVFNGKSLRFLCDALNELPDPETLYPADYWLAKNPKDIMQIRLQEAIYDKSCTYNEIIDALCGNHREKTSVRRDNLLAAGYALPRGDDFVLARLSSPLNAGISYDDRVLHGIDCSLFILAECAAAPITRSTAKMYANGIGKMDLMSQMEVAHSMPVSIIEKKKKIGLTAQGEEILRDYVPTMPGR